jgi:predicted lysophospholipase L1 biosynthesis ABC-type transport system permease subunit
MVSRPDPGPYIPEAKDTGMREFLYFVASLAGAAMLTALAVLFAPESRLWAAVFYVSAVILALCAIALLIDIIRRGAPEKMALRHGRPVIAS